MRTKLALLLCLVFATDVGATDRNRNRTERCRGNCSQGFFEFASASGSGMGAACACASVTGAKGEAMTFVRASSGTCLKGNVTSGIANGDMVTCSSNQPRVMPGGAGTGPLGILSETQRINVALRSQEFNNAVWVSSNSVAAAITITADAAVAPDGTTTAERFQIPAVASGWSLVQQLALGGAGTYSGGVFLKGNGQSGSIVLLIGSLCQTCSYTNGAWSLCTKTQAIGGASAFSIGQDVTDCGGGPFGTQDLFVWGGQFELGAWASSYIATAGATATRVKDRADFAGQGALITAVQPTGSAAATVIPNWTDATMPTDLGAVTANSDGQYVFLEPSGGNRIYIFDGTTIVRTTGAFTALSPSRLWSSWGGGSMTIANATAGTSNSGSFDNSIGSGTTLEIGHNQAGSFQVDGVVKQVCIDPSQSRCR